jgi:zinc protease
MRYYVRANPRPEKRAELRLVVNAGSVLEDDDQKGLAHFVEHMAFNGTRNFSKSAIVDFLELAGMRFGADVNASTGFDETTYMLQLPTDSARIMEQGLLILEDWAHGVTFDSLEVEKERGVVIEEWRAGRGASSRIMDKQLPVLLYGSRYAARIPIGNDTSLRTFSHAALKRFYNDWYRPDMMAVVAVGDFDAETMERQIRERFSRIPASASPRSRPVVPVPDHDSSLVAINSDPEETQTGVTVYFKHDSRSGATFADYRRRLVEAILDGVLNNRFSEITMKPDAPFLYAFGGQGGLVRSKDAYTVGVGVKDGGAVDGLRAALLESERLSRFGVTDTELARAKANMMRGMEQAFAERDKTNSASFASEYVRAFLDGEAFPGIDLEFELAQRFIPEVTLGELNVLSRELLSDRNRVILASAPQASSAPLPSAQELLAVFAAVDGAQLSAYSDNVSDEALIPVPPTPGSVASSTSIGELGVTEWRLSNGARVVLKPTDFKADQILFSAFSPGGSSLASDADAFVLENAGLAVEVGGVGTFDAISLGKKLAGKAAGVSPFIGSLEEGMSGVAAPADLETMLELAHLYFTSPRRDSAAYEAFRQSVRASLEHQAADPANALSDTLTRVITNYHPRIRLLSAPLLDSLDLDRSLAFYRDRFADAGDFTFVFVGNFTPDGIKPMVEKYLASLPTAGRKETWRDNGVRPPTGVVKREVRRGLEPKSETTIHFSGPLEYTRANRFAVSSLAEILNIRLREVLREDLGGTYGASASGGASRDPWSSYALSISFGAAPDRVEALGTAVFQEIDSLKANGARQQDVDKVKETLRRSYETNLKENGYWLGQLSAYYRIGDDPRLLLSYPQVIESLTPDLVKQSATRFLRTDNFIQVTLLPQR